MKAQLKLLEDATAEYSNSTTDACCELVDWTWYVVDVSNHCGIAN